MKLIDFVVAAGLTALCASPLAVGVAKADLGPNEHLAPATRAAVSALFVAGDEAQRAIDADWCMDVELVGDELAGDALMGEAARQYEHVEIALLAAFDASAGTDSAVEGELSAFCAWAGER